MTGWDVLGDIVNNFPPVAASMLLIVAVAIFIIGFSRRGVNFIKYGFGQATVDNSFAKRFDDLAARMATKDDIADLRTEVRTELAAFRTELTGFRTDLDTIKVNHFGHLKSYFGILNGVLLDKNIIDNETKARLDNELRGM